MTQRQFDLIIKKVIFHGNSYRQEMGKLEEWCEKKYGCIWSDLDCDSIIDNLEFGEGMLKTMTFQEFKAEIEKNLQDND